MGGFYIDGLWHYKNFDDHLENLGEVLQRLANGGQNLSPRKLFLFKKEVNCLGHKVTTKDICLASEKIEVVKDWPNPKNCFRRNGYILRQY